MAISAYEIRVIVSAQDHFSSAFRRINSDLRYMGRMQKAAAAEQERLNKALHGATTARRSALQEARSLRTGKAAQSLAEARLKSVARLATEQQKMVDITAKQADAVGNLATKETALNNLRARQYDLTARQMILASKLAGMTPDHVQYKPTELQESAARMRLAEIPSQRAVIKKDIAKAERQVKNLKSAWGSQMNNIKYARQELAAYDLQQVQNLEHAERLRESARKYGMTQKEVTAALNAQAAAQGRLQALERKRAIAQGVGHFGRVMSLAGGIGLAASGGLANMAANFENQVTLAATQMPGTAGKGVDAVIANANKLRPVIISMMKEFGVASADLSQQAYDVFSSISFEGANQFQQGVDMMKLASMAAVGGMTDLKTATQATIIIANQFGNTFGDVARNLDTAFAIVRYGNMTFAQFTSMMTKVGSAASRAGFSLQDVGGIMAFMTKKAGKPDEAATWIDRMLQALQTPEFIKGMRLLHAPIDRDGKLKPLTEVMDQILRLGVANRGRGGLGMQNIIPYITSVGKHGAGGGAGLRSTIQAQRGLTFSVQDLKSYKTLQAAILGDQGEFMRSFTAEYNQAGMKWQRLMAGFKAGALELGIAVLPAMIKIVGALAGLVTWFSNLSPHTKRMIGYFIAFGSAALLVAGVVTSVGGALAGLLVTVRILAGASGIGAAISAATRLGAVLTVLRSMSGIGIIVTMLIEKPKIDGWFEKHGLGFLNQGLGETLGLWGGDDKGKKAGKKAKTDLQKFMEKYQKEVKNAMKNMGKKQTAAAMKEYNDAINTVLNQTTGGQDEAAQAAADRARQVKQQAKSILDSAQQGLKRIYDEAKQNNEAMFGAAFGGPVSTSAAVQWRKSYGVNMNVSELLKDAKMQLEQFKVVRKNIALLTARGLNPEIITEIQAMGKEGVPILAALVGGTPQDIAQFNSYFKQKKGLIAAATEIDFTVHLDKWRSFGQKAALEIAAGMADEDYAVGKQLKALAAKWWTGMATSMAEAAVAADQGPAPAVNTLPLPFPPAGIVRGGVPGGHAPFNARNIKNAAGNVMGPLFTPEQKAAAGFGGPTIGSGGKGGGGGGGGATPFVQNFNVNGIFLSEQQMMDNALRVGSMKARNRRW